MFRPGYLFFLVVLFGMLPAVQTKANDLLIVHDGNGQYVSFYTNALPQGYSYEVWDVVDRDGLPTLEHMQSHVAVIWFTGDRETFPAGTRLLLRNYLCDFGNLFLSGAEIDMSDLGPFLCNQLFFAEGTGYIHISNAAPVVGHMDTSLEDLSFGITGQGGAGNNPSDLNGYDVDLTHAEPMLNYAGQYWGQGLLAGYRVDAPCHRIFFTCFNFESINVPAYRDVIMEEALDFLDREYPPETEIISGPEEIIPPQAISFTWTGYDDLTEPLLYEYRLCSDLEPNPA